MRNSYNVVAIIDSLNSYVYVTRTRYLKDSLISSTAAAVQV